MLNAFKSLERLWSKKLSSLLGTVTAFKFALLCIDSVDGTSDTSSSNCLGEVTLMGMLRFAVPGVVVDTLWMLFLLLDWFSTSNAIVSTESVAWDFACSSRADCFSLSGGSASTIGCSRDGRVRTTGGCSMLSHRITDPLCARKLFCLWIVEGDANKKVGSKTASA